MTWLIANFGWFMGAAGLLTMTMAGAALAPDRTVRGMFGEGVEGPAARLLIRNWGVLVTFSGALLVYGAIYPEARPLALLLAIVGKGAFIGLVLAHGRRYLRATGLFLVVDGLFVIAFATYLRATR